MIPSERIASSTYTEHTSRQGLIAQIGDANYPDLLVLETIAENLEFPVTPGIIPRAGDNVYFEIVTYTRDPKRRPQLLIKQPRILADRRGRIYVRGTHLAVCRTDGNSTEANESDKLAPTLRVYLWDPEWLDVIAKFLQ